MPSYNPELNNFNGFQFTGSSVENKGLFSRILRGVNNWGMDYNDMIARNQVGVGINEDPYSQQGDSMYDFFSKRAVAAVLNKKSIPYLDRSYADKRRILREYSIKDEIRDFVSTVSDECVVYSDKDFCSVKNIANDVPQEVRDKYQEFFEIIYNRYQFADSITAWNLIKDFLIDGYLAIEIIWDDKKKNIISFNRMRPETLVPAHEPSIGNIWIQYPEDPKLRRIFLDSQIIFVSYSTQNDFSETSYVEGLIKPYNQLKIIEQTRIMFNIVNATVYQKFTIPIKGYSRQNAEQQVGQLIHDYSEEVEWDDSLGTVTINGTKHLPYNKQIWLPEGDAGTPQMELVSPEGHNLNESDMLTWFYNILKRASKIPFARFEKENGGGNIFTDAAEMTRDEVKFSNFINRIRSNFKEIIVKPLKLQMAVEFPEIKDDERILNQIDIDFNSNHLFEEWKRLGNLEKKAGIVGTLLSIQKDENTPYFHIEFLMDDVFKLTAEQKEENKRYWAREKSGSSAEGTPGEGSDVPSEMSGSDMGPSGSDIESPPSEGGDFEAPAAAEPSGGPESTPPPTSEPPGGAESEFEF